MLINCCAKRTENLNQLKYLQDAFQMCLLVTYWSSQQDESPAAEVRSQLQSISVRLTDVLETLKEFNMSYFYIGAIPDNNFSASDSLMPTEEPETAVKHIGRSGQANRNRFVWTHLDTLQHAVFCASCTGAQRFICHAVIYCDLSELQQHERIKQCEELWHKTLPGELRSDSVKCSLLTGADGNTSCEEN